MVGWHHQLNGHEFEQALGIGWTWRPGLEVFPTFFSLSLNLAIRNSGSEPQSAPSLIFADCIELLHHWLQRI